MVYKKKIKKFYTFGVVHIRTAARNIIISVSNNSGDVLCWASTGTVGYTGPKKKSLIAALSVAKNVAKQAQEYKIESISIVMKGPTENREDIIQVFRKSGFTILSIKNLILVPHNGCRPPKKRKL